ncbi:MULTISPECIES: hypothetical protein [unclassified Herbaspirillum]|uniref:hypothetical protein n=1 Tax=unclassified Herbaspirillum TaxID=2624150 RepID=UPI00115487E2|nr:MULTISPECIES: hypothetical protein [unclassified Herbaspirillum]MBB5392002.1 hypothetical protein [Herbaspirillum sp. SJZ102]TQK13462.1 hypothetical protein FB599_0879 [Herbaspirillum sp. SJZ130]TQK15465.1 hypothetical protein FB598_0816 [Herbaspirillum sp. SJZ106]TWC71362.1 hypothetical protein FB597_101333 [Herbaspirillum sp. SJZ099]
METPDPWIERADELKAHIEVLLETQLNEYEQMVAKLEQWKQNPAGPWLTMADYEPWQTALKNLEAAQREFDLHINSREK